MFVLLTCDDIALELRVGPVRCVGVPVEVVLVEGKQRGKRDYDVPHYGPLGSVGVLHLATGLALLRRLRGLPSSVYRVRAGKGKGVALRQSTLTPHALSTTNTASSASASSSSSSAHAQRPPLVAAHGTAHGGRTHARRAPLSLPLQRLQPVAPHQGVIAKSAVHCLHKPLEATVKHGGLRPGILRAAGDAVHGRKGQLRVEPNFVVVSVPEERQ